MNKQIVIAGLLGAIAAAEGDDPTPCSDIVTKVSEEAKATAEAMLEAWEGKIEGLEEAAEIDGLALEGAQLAYNQVTAAVLPFYTAMEEANEDWQAAVGVKQAATGLLTSIENGAVNTISGETMLLGEAAPTVGAAADAVADAQEDYDDKYAEINAASFTDVDSASQTGFRAYLTSEIRQESLMIDAESTAGDAESLAITNYEDQEAVHNALLAIEGCAEVSYDDLGLDGEEEAVTVSGTEEAEDAEYVVFEECCDARLSTYLVAESSANDCDANVGFGMKDQSATNLASQTTLEATYNSACTTTTTSCDGDTEFTDYRDALKAKMKALRMQSVVDEACTDWDGSSATYDCSNGVLSNSNTAWGTGDALWHELNDVDGNTPADVDPIWTYRGTISVTEGSQTATATEDITGLEGTWTPKYEGLANALKDWTVAEARYWAYEAAWDIHAALIVTAESSEDALKVTRDQKIDLLDAADAQVLAANKKVSMATSDLDDEIAALDVLQASLVAAEEAHAVQVYLAAQADAAALVQSTIVADWSEICGDAGEAASCYNALDDLEALYNTAESNFDEIQEALSCASFAPGSCTGFYRTALDELTEAAEMSSGALGTAEGMVNQLEFETAGAVTMVQMAIATCKGLGYDKAQAAKKMLMDLESANEEAAAEVATDYEAKSAFAETGETNTLCAFPEKGSDGSQEARPECKDGYCCGAAQKFLKDGTKLAIETCQKAEGIHTYDYYPPLPEGSPVEPTPETWRFQCISGAQKLAATAAAALAASYMMA